MTVGTTVSGQRKLEISNHWQKVQALKEQLLSQTVDPSLSDQQVIKMTLAWNYLQKISSIKLVEEHQPSQDKFEKLSEKVKSNSSSRPSYRNSSGRIRSQKNSNPSKETKPSQFKKIQSELFENDDSSYRSSSSGENMKTSDNGMRVMQNNLYNIDEQECNSENSPTSLEKLPLCQKPARFG